MVNNYPVILRILGFFNSSFSRKIHHPWLLKNFVSDATTLTPQTCQETRQIYLAKASVQTGMSIQVFPKIGVPKMDGL